MVNRSPRCNGLPETAHHTKPTSQFPEFFFDVRFIVACCKPCNYGDGARIAAANGRRRRARLEEIVLEQEQRIAHLVERLAVYEDAERAKRVPAIH